jgi:hypothetical protein
VPVRPAGAASVDDTTGSVVVTPVEGFCAAQSTTLLTPTSVSDWVKVMDWEASKLFKDSNIRPQIIVGESTVDRMPVASGVVLNPDDLTPLTTDGAQIQFMIRVKVAYSLPQVTTANFALKQGGDVALMSVADLESPDSTPCLVNVTGIRNSM